MELAPGAVIGGKFRIERPLARGGMGSLWVARHVQLGSTVAIKFLDASFAASPAHRARFEREARAAASLKSPHVVQVHDYGFEGTAPYIVMELLEGEDLGHRLHRVRRMSLHDTARILTQVGKALRKAHEAGIAHRDLKPANLYLARDDDDEVVKILDFGIAKEQHSTLGDATRTGEVIGSPHYMSPEQVRAERDVDHRTDLWSMGIILYRMLVGVLPFPGDQLGPVLARILTDPIPVPTLAAPDLPRSMDAFFARALARDKLQRFQSIGEMVEAFQAAAGGREAFPSISMSLGTGPMQAAGGPPAWSPPAATTMTGSALVTASGPITGSAPLTGSGPLAMSNPITGPGSIPMVGPPMVGPPVFAAPGPMAGSGVQSVTGPMGPPTGSETSGGLTSTGAAPRPKGAGLALVIGVAAVAAVAAVVIGFFALRGSSDEEVAAPAATPTAAATSTAPPSVEPVPPAAPTEPVPSAAPAEPASPVTAPSASSAAPDASPSAAAGSPSPTTKPTVVKPKGTARPKEKWF